LLHKDDFTVNGGLGGTRELRMKHTSFDKFPVISISNETNMSRRKILKMRTITS
jgi:hypothetical protein